jgi:hypothetical protein
VLKRLFSALPGPMPVRLLVAVVIVAVLVVVLVVVFEALGRFLDDGGVMG